MKAGLIFFLLVVVLIVVFTMRLNIAKVSLKDNRLVFYNKKCKNAIDVNVIKKESDLVDELDIDRYYLKLPNGDEVIYEVVDLPPARAFDKPYIEILEGIFDMKFKKVFESDGFVLYRGDFDVALFYKAKNELVLIYPADNLKDVLIECFKNNKAVPLPKEVKKVPFKKSRWDIKLIILDNIINKDI